MTPSGHAASRRRWWLVPSTCAALLSWGRSARALDAFEIQVYDASANAPGAAGVELHVNRVFSGARSAEPPALPPHHQTHFTLEPSYGLLPFLELGAYFQTALRADGRFDYAGTKLRAKFVLPEPPKHLRLGCNFEVSLVPQAYEPERWGTEVRPILAYEDERWLMAVNPILGISYTGPEAGKGPELEPAVMLKLKFDSLLAAGVEYYAAFGRIGALASPREQQHYLFEALDLLAIHSWELNAGVGEGLTAASSSWIGKFIVGYTTE